MKQYLDLLKDVRTNGVLKPSGRIGMPDVIGLTHGTMTVDLREGLPLLTTKKMFYKGIIHELLWYMSGDTNIKYLVQNDCNFWNKNAYTYYLKRHYVFVGNAGVENAEVAPLSFDGFIHRIYTGNIRDSKIPHYLLGDLGPVYGKQWRDKDGIDQLKALYDSLIDNPFERYKLMDLWSPRERPQMALPPCLILYQFLVEPYEGGLYLDLNMYQRSADIFLGVPFDITSMSIFLHIMAKATGMTPRYAFWIGGHCDIYEQHLESVDTQLSRVPTQLPHIKINKELKSFKDITSLTINDFEIIDYVPQGKLAGELFA